MSTIYDDPEFARHTVVVIDFETTAAPGRRPPEPLEVAAIALAAGDGDLHELWRFEELIKPPPDRMPGPPGAAVNHITPETLREARPAADVLGRLDQMLDTPPYRLVAHHAPFEASVIASQRAHCPRLAGCRMLDTVRMARRALPALASHRLDALLRHYAIPIPAGRHRALPDVELTVLVLRSLLRARWGGTGPATLTRLDALTGLSPSAAPARHPPAQLTLF